MTNLLRLGHKLSYNETKFIEDKWAKWSKKQPKFVPNNFRKGVVTHVVDNIDWKNNSFESRDTHTTNSILIQQNM